MINKKYIILTSTVVMVLFGCGNNETNHNTNQNNDMSQNIEKEDKEENEWVSIIETFDDIDSSYTELVNKENPLTEEDDPTDLVTIDVPYVLDNPEVNQMREEAALALKEMFDKAKEDDVELLARSGFRSYNTQVSLFNANVEKNGEEEANRYSARPGESEHQTGLVMDVTSEEVDFELTEEFGEVPSGQWVQDHAHEFGFIIRYPKDQEDITGYVYEPWHLRYVTKEVAELVYENDLTYEEFIEQIEEHRK